MMGAPTMTIRNATLADVDDISQLVDRFTETGDLLPRSAESIRLSIDTWVLGFVGDKMAGIGSLLVYTPLLAEVRSLAVLPETQGTGMGRAIVAQLTDDAIERKIPTLFALTRAVPFFERIGFTITEKENFPEKIWHACRVCPIKDNCDEIAVVLPLDVSAEIIPIEPRL